MCIRWSGLSVRSHSCFESKTDRLWIWSDHNLFHRHQPLIPFIKTYPQCLSRSHQKYMNYTWEMRTGTRNHFQGHNTYKLEMDRNEVLVQFSSEKYSTLFPIRLNRKSESCSNSNVMSLLASMFQARIDTAIIYQHTKIGVILTTRSEGGTIYLKNESHPSVTRTISIPWLRTSPTRHTATRISLIVQFLPQRMNEVYCWNTFFFSLYSIIV